MQRNCSKKEHIWRDREREGVDPGEANVSDRYCAGSTCFSRIWRTKKSDKRETGGRCWGRSLWTFSFPLCFYSLHKNRLASLMLLRMFGDEEGFMYCCRLVAVSWCYEPISTIFLPVFVYLYALWRIFYNENVGFLLEILVDSECFQFPFFKPMFRDRLINLMNRRLFS